MAIKVMRRFVKGIVLKGAIDADIASEAQNGAVFNSAASARLKAYIQDAVREIVTSDQTQTLSGKTLTNPVVNAAGGSVVLPTSAAPAQTALGSIVYDSVNKVTTVGNGAGRNILVDRTTAQDLTNKGIKFPSALHVKQGTTAALVTYAAGLTSADNGQFVFATDTKTMYQVVDSLIVTLAGPASGENNTASNVGTGAAVFKQKAVFDLQFKSLKVSGGLTIVPTADDITFGYVPPTPVTSLAVPQVAISTTPQTLTVGQDGSTLSVDAIVPITINLPASPTSGTRYIFKCNRGKCGVNPITIVRGAGHTIENLAANYLLESNYGAWIFVFDGVSNWVIL